MKISFACCCVAIAGLASASAETTAQKLKYLKDITGVSCSAERLAAYAAPNGRVSETIPPPAHVTVIRGRLDQRGHSWLYVSHDKTRRHVGWVKLLDVSCV